MIITLEALECDAPCDSPVAILAQRTRVIPAGWWLWSAKNIRWISIADIRWWQMWCLWRLRNLSQWPLRLCVNGKVVWKSQAAPAGVKPGETGAGVG